MKKLFLTACMFLTIASGWQQTSAGSGQVSGIITDIFAARIVNAKIGVTGNGSVKVFSTNGEGAYSFSLEPGIYEITITSYGFCPTSRPFFKIDKGSKTTFDFVLVVCPIVHKLVYEQDKYVGETANYEAPYKEDRYRIKSLASKPFDLLIRYGKRGQDNDQVKYLGYKTEIQFSLNGKEQTHKQELPVTAMYDLLTIEADEILYDEKHLELVAKGRVKVQDGNKRWGKDQLIFKFINGTVEIQNQN